MNPLAEEFSFLQPNSLCCSITAFPANFIKPMRCRKLKEKILIDNLIINFEIPKVICDDCTIKLRRHDTKCTISSINARKNKIPLSHLVHF